MIIRRGGLEFMSSGYISKAMSAEIAASSRGGSPERTDDARSSSPF
jgi:hypothetical protein